MSWIIAPSAFISKLTVQHIICTYLVFLLLLPFIHHCIPSILPSSDFNKFNTIIQYHMHLSLVFLLLLSLKHRNTPSILPFSRFHRLGVVSSSLLSFRIFAAYLDVVSSSCAPNRHDLLFANATPSNIQSSSTSIMHKRKPP